MFIFQLRGQTLKLQLLRLLPRRHGWDGFMGVVGVVPVVTWGMAMAMASWGLLWCYYGYIGPNGCMTMIFYSKKYGGWAT